MNEEKTKISKGFYGWTGESIVTNVNGYDWSITTMKRSSGKITSSAQAGKKTPSGFTYAVLSDPRKELGGIKANATEKSISEQHYKALAMFDHLKENNELVEAKQNKEYQIKPGQIIFLNGYGQDEYSHDRKVVYDIKETQWGTSYYYLNIDKLQTGIADHIRDIDNKFGIGTYYKKDDVYPLDDKFNNLLIETIEKEKIEQQRKESSVELAKAEREAKIEEGKKLVNIPEGAKSVLVAHLKVNESDAMTDYFNHSESKTIYLAFSNHNRDLFSEMRVAALNCDDVKHLADLPKDAENRHKYSMGSGYWLGEHHHQGWEIRKERLVESNIYIAASEGRVFFPEFGLNDKQSKEVLVLPEVGYRFMKDGWEHEIYNVRDKDNNQKIYFRNLNTNDEFNISAKEFDKQLKEGKISFTQTSNLKFAPGPGVELKSGDAIELHIKEGEQSSLVQGKFVALEKFGQIIHLEDVITDTFVNGKNEVTKLEYLELNVHDAVPNTIIGPIKIIENQNQLNINSQTLNNEVMKKEETNEQTAQAEVKTENGLKFNEQGVKGNLVKAPEVKELEGGKKMVQFTVGVNETSKTGKVTTNFIDCSAFGKQAEKIESMNLEKGAYLEVGGKANFYETNKDDKGKNYHNSITVNHIQELGKEKGSNVGVETKFDKPNHIEIKGNLVKDPEFKNIPGGKLVAEITLAHNYIVGDKPEDKRVMYINANVFGKAAEALQNNKIEKGASVGVKGSIDNQNYVDKDGNKRQTVKINSNFVEINKSKEKVEDKEVSVDVQAETKKVKAPKKGKSM